MSPFICVVLAIYRPDRRYLAAQLASLAAQTRRPDLLLAVIADTVSADLVTETCAIHGLPLRLSLPAETLDSVAAFQCGLHEALDHTPEDTLYALCDQDDVWHPERLEQGIAALAAAPVAGLAHSDARVIDAAGKVLHPSLFAYERRLRAPGLRGLLYRNTVTGMTTLIRRRVVELALPFPRQSGVHFYHDLWLALVAEATGGIALIRTPLVDYRQHSGNAVGAVNRSGPSDTAPPSRRRRIDMSWLRREAAAYGLARYLAVCLDHRVRQALPPGGADTAGLDRLRPLRAYLGRMRGPGRHLADMLRYGLTGHPGVARLAAGAAIVSSGRIFWSLRNAMTEGLTRATRVFDDRLFSLAPGVQPVGTDPEADRSTHPQSAASFIDSRKTARWTPDFTAPAASVTVLVPTLNPTEIFAGIATAVDMGLALAAAGHPVRFIATDLPVAAPAVSLQFLTRRLGAAQKEAGAETRISLHCGVTAKRIPAHREDRFVATAWWTAILARKLIAQHGFLWHRYLYLIQDFEPGFYPWGTEYADALASYDDDFIPLFNTTLLRDHFAAQGFAFAGPDAAAFRPAIDVARYAATPRPEKPANAPRRIVLYGRPEVARNLFGTAVEALSLFLTQTEIPPAKLVIDSVGLRHPPVILPRGHRIVSRGKLPYEEYPGYLASADIGLSLMLSPHPSHPPLEMAASGVRVVTNGFGSKDLSRFSPALISVAPEPQELARALTRAWRLPPVTAAERQIDISPLGEPLETCLDRLAPRLLPPLRPEEAPSTRRIILHVGAPKCGSTYLQKVFLKNRARLARLGISYPHDGDPHPGNATGLETITADRLLADFGTGHTVIYSHEDLLANVPKGSALMTLAAELGITVDVVAFLRPFSELMFGTYSQMMKQNFETYLTTGQPYDGFDFEGLVQQAQHSYAFDRFLRGWARRNPDRPLILRHSSEIRATFEDLLGTREIDWSLPPDQANPSLRTEDCDRLAAMITEGKLSARRIRREFVAAHGLVGGPDRGRSPARIALVETLFADCNKGLEDWFGFDNRLSPPPAAPAVAEPPAKRAAAAAPR
jgi:hypothetical protein